MKVRSYADRLVGAFLVLIILVAAWTLAVKASAPAAPLQNLPDGSTINGTLSTDDDWGPGTITVTGDVTITAGTIITINPGTTVQMNITDVLKSGTDITRTEWIISGTLRANGPVTFTSQGSPPACADWYGLRFMPDSDGYLDDAIVEYAVHSVVISTTNPISVTDSTLRYNCHVLSPSEFGDVWGAGMAIFTGTHYVASTHIYSNVLETSG